MKHNIIKIFCASAVLAVMSGCATQPGRTASSFNSFCTLAGAVVGGGGAAIVSTAAAGPIGAGIGIGALLGTLACSEGPPPPEPMAAVVPQEAPPPAPEMDSDGDGVVDSLDRCPDTPAGEKVDANGCPPVLLTLTGVKFAFDSSRISPDSEQILNQAVEALNKASSVDVRIVGHTDSVGSEAYNLKLSERRANAVRDYLIQHGISGARLTTEGKGESEPVASNTTAEGRYQNRRVEFDVVGVEPMSSSGDSMSTESWRRLDQTVVHY